MKNKLTTRELSSFCGQMGMLLHSGISTAEGLHILCDESKTDADRQILTPLIRSVEENGSLSRALDESGVFPSSMTAYVRTGEETGCLDEIGFQSRCKVFFYNDRATSEIQENAAFLHLTESVEIK